MPRCACDTDAKRPCTKRAAQRVLARFVNALIASKMRSTMPSAGRSHLLTSGHAAQEQCQLPHAITMATHTARGVYSQEHKSNGSEAVRRRHQREASWQFITVTASNTSACHCTPSSMAAKSSVGTSTTNMATIDGWTVHVATHSCEDTCDPTVNDGDRLSKIRARHTTRNRNRKTMVSMPTCGAEVAL